jgi:hypothetical protein
LGELRKSQLSWPISHVAGLCVFKPSDWHLLCRYPQRGRGCFYKDKCCHRARPTDTLSITKSIESGQLDWSLGSHYWQAADQLDRKTHCLRSDPLETPVRIGFGRVS